MRSVYNLNNHSALLENSGGGLGVEIWNADIICLQ